jgi:hypothetical protein
MATNKRDLKAYVRFDGTGRIIPGSLVLRRAKPKVGNWKEIEAYECCNPGGGTFTTNIVFPVIPEFPDQFFIGFGFIVRCNENNVLSYFIEYPLEVNTTQEIVDYLNPIFTGVATFSVVNFNTISVSFSQVIADALCPSGVLTVEPNVPA